MEIRSAVLALLERAGIEEPPVDLERLARRQGIEEIREARMGSTLGMLHERRGRLTVTLNQREPLRARFTLAHEIAHTMVEPDRDAKPEVVLALRQPRRRNLVERLCDEVAGELLMPHDMFVRLMGAQPPALRDVQRLARTFDASLTATAVRVGHVTHHPVQVALWEREGTRGLEVRFGAGQPFLTARGAPRRRSLEDDKASPVVQAFLREKSVPVTGVEAPLPEHPWNTFDCEAQAFGKGSRRFVLSIVRPRERTGEGSGGA